MADIELVVKMPEETYKGIMLGKWDGNGLAYYVKVGTLLPKGHGRLIDADAVLAEPIGNTYKDIDIAETIIEADKKYEAKVITRGNCMICGKELTEGLFLCKECGDKGNSRK